MLPLLNYITWDVSPFIYEGEHFAIQWYGTLWCIGLMLWIASQLIIYKHESIPSEYVWYKFLYMCLGVLIGARIGHCWFYEWHLTNNPIHFLGMDFWYRNIYIEKPWLMFDIRNGVRGLSSHGGACGLLIAALLLDRKFKTGLIWMFDRAVFGVCLCGACIRLGNLFNSEIYGVATSVPWGFIFVNRGDPFPSHPTQIYEMLYCLITLAILIFLYCQYDAGKYNGLLFGVFMICIFATRIGLEFIKNDQEPFEANIWLNMGQWLSIPFVLWGIYLVVKSLKEGKQPARVPQGLTEHTKKKKKRNATILLLALILASCNQPARMENTYRGQYSIQKELDDEFLLEGLSNQIMYSKCIFYHYTSENSDGVTDTLSAVLTINRNCWKRGIVKGLTLWNRPTITAERDCPSSGNLIAEPLIAKYTHTAIVSPDLQGFGCNNKPQAYCYAEKNGRAAADALYAAYKILDSVGITCRDNTLYNIGYSQGAQTALAALPYFSQFAEVTSFFGEGIYDLTAYYNQAIDNDSIEIPADIPLSLITAIECGGAELDYAKCFADSSQISLVTDALSKQYTFPELNRRVHYKQLSRILSPQLCDSTTAEYAELTEALRKMSYIPYRQISGNNTVYLFHSTTDKIMPIEQSFGIESTLKDSCSLDAHHKYKDFGSHDEAILPFVKYVILRMIF